MIRVKLNQNAIGHGLNREVKQNVTQLWYNRLVLPTRIVVARMGNDIRKTVQIFTRRKKMVKTNSAYWKPKLYETNKILISYCGTFKKTSTQRIPKMLILFYSRNLNNMKLTFVLVANAKNNYHFLHEFGSIRMIITISNHFGEVCVVCTLFIARAAYLEKFAHIFDR